LSCKGETFRPGRKLCQRTHDARTIIAFLAVSLSLRIADASYVHSRYLSSQTNSE